MNTFTFYTDPGHGWIKIPMRLINSLGIEDGISSHSYYRNGFAYLEEDCDAKLFLDRMKELDIEVKFREKYTDRNSKIRNYEYFKGYGGTKWIPLQQQ